MPRATLYVLNGKIVNVGPWDEQREPVMERRPRMGEVKVPEPHGKHRVEVQHLTDPDTLHPLYDDVPTGEEIVRNPVPDGVAIVEDGEYLVTADERIVLASEYGLLRRAEYPPMTDYLDAVVKGDKPAQAAYVAACRAVKAKYPKPDSPGTGPLA